MNNKLLASIAVVLVVVGFAAGRYSVNKNTSTTTTENTATKETDTKKRVVRVIVKNPDGSSTSTTTIDSNKKEKAAKESKSNTAQSTVVAPKVNVSLLAGVDSKTNFTQPTYGLSVSKEMIGPVSVGAFGLSNGLVGISLGMGF